MVLSFEVLAIWLVDSLFGGVVYDKAKDLFGEDPFLKITRKAQNEALKKEDSKIIWNRINELKDIKIKDPTKDFTWICNSLPVDYRKMCHNFFEDLKKEYLKELHNRGEDYPLPKFLLDQARIFFLSYLPGNEERSNATQKRPYSPPGPSLRSGFSWKD